METREDLRAYLEIRVTAPLLDFGERLGRGWCCSASSSKCSGWSVRLTFEMCTPVVVGCTPPIPRPWRGSAPWKDCLPLGEKLAAEIALAVSERCLSRCSNCCRKSSLPLFSNFSLGRKVYFWPILLETCSLRLFDKWLLTLSSNWRQW